MPVLLLCLLLSILAVPASATENLRIQQLSVQEGLSQNSVTSLVKDRDGFLWVATETGLNRYDGYEFEHIGGPDNIFRDQYISMIERTADGSLWVAVPSHGLYELDYGSHHFELRIEASMADSWWFEEIIAIYEDDARTLWILSEANLIQYDRETGDHNAIYTLDDVSAGGYDIIRDAIRLGEYMLLATSRGLDAVHVETRAITPVPHLPEGIDGMNVINTKVLRHFNERLLIATVEGLYALPYADLYQSLHAGTTLPKPEMLEPQMNIWDITVLDSSVMLATHQGLFEYHPNWPEPRPRVRLSDSTLPIFDNSIRKLLRDEQGNFWLGTGSNGLFYWRPSTRNFTNLLRGSPPTRDLSNNVVWALAEDITNNLWIGTQNGLDVLTADNQHRAYLRSKDQYSLVTSGTIYDIFPDPEDASRLWLHIADAIKIFDVEDNELTDLPAADEQTEALLQEYGWAYYLDDNEQLWFFTESGLHHYDIRKHTNTSYTEFGDSEFDPLNAFYVLGRRPGHPNEMLLAVASELWVFNLDDQSFRQVYRHDPYQLYTYITPESMVVDQQNRLWLTMSGSGIVVFDNETLDMEFRLQADSGLPSNSVYEVRRGTGDDLWVSSHTGLLRIDSQTLHVEQFTYEDGVSSNEFNYRSSAALSDGRLAYGSLRGVTVFDPQDFTRGENRPDMRITNIDVLATQERLDLPYTDLDGQSIKLAHDTAGLRVHVSSLDYGRQSRVTYRYELEGPDAMTIPATRQRYIAFPRLSPGRYTLTVQATDPRSGNLSEVARLRITIAHQPWLSPWAYALYLLLALLLIGFAFYYRHRQHQRVLHSKERAEHSEERLQLALSASDSGVWDWQAESNSLYENRIREQLGHQLEHQIKLEDHLNLIHRRDKSAFMQQWKALFNSNQSDFACTYRMRHVQGHWLWFRDVGRVTRRNNENLPERITGAFQNITSERASQEKAMLFGKAFEQTMDWVLLLDADQQLLSANQAFCRAVGVDPDQLNLTGYKGMSDERLRYYQAIITKLQPGQQWRGEDKVTLANGNEVPVLINISAVAGNGEGDHAYVVVLTNISAQKEAEDKLRQLASFDPLTGLANRTLLNDRLAEAISRSQRHANHIAVLFIDLDRFKQINDSLGHSIGDQLLCIVASRIQNCLRDQDTVARLGGDEFIILLDGADSEHSAVETAHRVLRSINEPLLIQQHHIRISPSIGIARFPEHGHCADELLKHADVAMYHAKDAGRNCVQVFRDEMDTEVRERLALEVDLKQAIARGELVNYYQPIIDAQHGNQPVGCELLLRWPHKNGFIGPDRFIPVAEDLGIIIPLTYSALRQGLTDVKRMRELYPDLYLSVNLSVRHLDHSELPQEVDSLLHEYSLPPSALRFEITEGILIEETMRASSVMRQLRELGVLLLLDDFGTGYSSLRYVKSFPVGVIKIDRSFTQDIGCDKSDESIIESILAMARNLDKRCVAEGVETQAQRKWLLERHCNLMQGYLFARPMPLTNLLEWLVTRRTN
jgi:diguanylate cyclase (GGDEF)-like protein/PAS domain S-box-containing protein